MRFWFSKANKGGETEPSTATGKEEVREAEKPKSAEPVPSPAEPSAAPAASASAEPAVSPGAASKPQDPEVKKPESADSAAPAASAVASTAAPDSKNPEAPKPELKVTAKPSANPQRELYRSLMDALYDAILIVDEKGYVVDGNRRVEHIFGYKQSEMWDMPLQKMIKGFGLHVLAKLAEPLDEGRPVIISGSGICRDGSQFTAEIAVSRIKLLRAENILFAIRNVSGRVSALKDKIRAQLKAEKTATGRIVRLVPSSTGAAASKA